MEVGAEKEAAPSGSVQGLPAQHNLVEQLHLRLNRVWRYGECLAEAFGKPAEQALWRRIRLEELDAIGRLRRRIADNMDQGIFQQGL